jgi:hypothetical protein
MIGSSVVPGLPNIRATPSAFSSSTNAVRPLILLDWTVSDMSVADLRDVKDYVPGIVDPGVMLRHASLRAMLPRQVARRK